MLLQNRGRMSAPQLARLLEVAPRTVLRDVEALEEAGVPIRTQQGQGGGIELAFGFRSRLTGLSAAEAEAAGLLLSADLSAFEALGLGAEVRRVQSKLFEALPDPVRKSAAQTAARFGLSVPAPPPDPRLAALARAVRERRIVRIDARRRPQVVHPLALHLGVQATLLDGVSGEAVPEPEWRDLNISAKSFVMTEAYTQRLAAFGRRRDDGGSSPPPA